MQKSTLIITALIAMLIIVWPANAHAAYRPAPPHIVAAALRHHAPRAGTTAKRAWIVCHVWGRYRCRAALNVAWCEGGLSPYASNGQYQGTFQMSTYNRSTYGHGNIWAQARAALALWFDRHWSPWECQPGSIA